MSAVADGLRNLPSVDRLLSSAAAERLLLSYGKSLTVEAIRRALNEVRQAIRGGRQALYSDEELVGLAESILVQQTRATLRSVVNATGVIVHTNLGRALMSQPSIDAIGRVAANYSNLEYDLDAGTRGSRTVHAEDLLRQLTGARAALAVNNNAAAVLLMLAALCEGKEVIISRGQLIEIGGGFRIPDVMGQSGATLVEVGTTNRTHLRDYQNAIGDETAAILVAHRSNFRMAGFTSEPELTDICKLAHEHGIFVLYDQGSGAIHDLEAYGLGREMTVQEAIRIGIDVVAFSGDKLLGGPQAGILCGRDELLEMMKRHPLARAVRADKMCLAALSETLRAHLMARAEVEVPVWKMISANLDDIRMRAEGWVAILAESGIQATLRQGHSTVGGGSLPGSTLPTWLAALELDDVEAVATGLRATDPAVVGRIKDGRLLLDPRTVLEDQDQSMLSAVVKVVAGGETTPSGGKLHD